jgi:teichuronic acid biosynthesis protein TuaE
VLNLHNYWVEILVSYGLIIFLLYIFIYFNTVFKAYSNHLHHESRKLKKINLIILCLLISFPIAAIGPSNVFLNEWTWPLIALMMKIPLINETEVMPGS